MSLVGFKAKNHPQQLFSGGRGNPDIDDRATVAEVFGPLHERFRFDLDVAATAENKKCERYFDVDVDGLAQPWGGGEGVV